MTWMQFGAHPYDIGTDIMPGVTIREVAHSLARINRFTGHSQLPISVARHSVFVSELLDFDSEVAMYGLLHDMAESVTGDISYPMKKALRAYSTDTALALDEITFQAEVALARVFGVKWPMPEETERLVKRADNTATMTEKRELMSECPRPWDMLKEKASHRRARSTTCPYEDAALFMERYSELARHLGITPSNGEHRA